MRFPPKWRARSAYKSVDWDNLQFGGMNEKGSWKAYEIEWLRTLAVPLYFARVSADCTRVDFYSLWPMWQILGGSSAPFRIICDFDDASDSPFALPELGGEAGGSAGDGNTYRVPLGPPFLSATQEQLSDLKFNQCAVELMSMWVKVDRAIVTRLLFGLPNFNGISEWFTNDCNFPRGVPLTNWTRILARTLTNSVSCLSRLLQA
jgi:hypothetical protein